MGKHFHFASRLSERPCSMAHVSLDARAPVQVRCKGKGATRQYSSVSKQVARWFPLPCILRKQLRQWFGLTRRLTDGFCHLLHGCVLRLLEVFGVGFAPFCPDGN